MNLFSTFYGGSEMQNEAIKPNGLVIVMTTKVICMLAHTTIDKLVELVRREVMLVVGIVLLHPLAVVGLVILTDKI